MKSFMSFAREGNRPKIEQLEWMKSKKMELVKSIDQLGQIINESIKSGLYALDLETTGLNTTVYDGRTVDKIVGFCLSYDGESGYYVPVRHTGAGESANLPLLEVEAQFRRLADSDAIGVFHNAKFDHAFLRYNGGDPMGLWDEHKRWEDTLILAYLRNSRTRRKGLKALSLLELDCEMIELKQLFPPATKNYDFSTLDPNWAPVIWYAASDALCTYNLFKVLYPQVVGAAAVPNQQVIYSVEKMCIPATLWMETNRVPICQEKVRELIQIGQAEYFEAIKAVYAFCEETLGRDVSPPWWKVLSEGVSFEDGDGDPKAPIPPVFDADDTVMDFTQQCEEAEKIVKHNSKRPTWDQSIPLSLKTEQASLKEARILSTGEERDFPYQYDVLSPQQLGPLMEEMEVPDLRYTEKSKQVMTTAGEMDRLTEMHGETFPFMAKIKRFRALHKALSTFLYPLRLRKDGGDASDIDSTIKINYNGLKVDTGRFATPGTKRGHLDGGTRYNIHSTPAGYDPSRPECLRRLRECIRAREDHFILANDYSGVELRIVTNLSREPKWITEYFRCSQCDFKFSRGDGASTPEAPPPFCPNCGSDKIGDLHSLSATSFYGQGCTANLKEFKLLRQKAKGVNFALCYGGSGKAVVRTINCDDNEGWRIARQFNDTYRGLQDWWKKQQSFGKQHGYVLSALGRKYPVPDIQLKRKTKDPDTGQWRDNGGFIAKAERNSINGPIQACLHSDSRIQTSLGLLPVGELWERQSEGEYQGFDVWTGRGWEKGRALFSGEKRLVRTEMIDGRVLQTSPEHLFRCWSGRSETGRWQDSFEWAQQRSLVPKVKDTGTWVAVDTAPGAEYPEPSYKWAHEVRPQQSHKFTDGFTPHNAKPFKFEGNSELLWEFLGLIYGDGSIMENALSLHVGGSEFLDGEKLAQEYAEALDAELGVGVTVYYPKDVDAYVARTGKKPVWQVKVHNASFRAFTREVLGVEDANTYTKRVPSALWKESAKHRRAFLRGILTADGSTSATGDTVSLRGVNRELMRDCQALFHSVGIRASYTPKCDRVTVLDRDRYFEEVGYSVSHKMERLANRKPNPWVGQWHLLPRDLIAWVGEVVHRSSVYSSFTSAQQSAVIRLKAGSGSKPQCLKYLNQVPESEVPTELREILKYDYQRVRSVEDTGETVTMYDIEVFDDDHAFVCDGVVVHNTSADITKLAMALTYREFKAAGLLDKCKMIITMHDELVFEVHKDYVEQALDILKVVMARNKAILSLRWPVPLTLDYEIAKDWTATHNLTEMFEGKAEWDPSLKPHFPKAVARLEALQRGEQEVASENDAAVAAAGPAAMPKAAVDPHLPDLKAGETYDYRLRHPRRQGTVEKLVQVLAKCEGKGTHPLRIKFRERDEGDSGLDLKGYFTNPIIFKMVAEEYGL